MLLILVLLMFLLILLNVFASGQNSSCRFGVARLLGNLLSIVRIIIIITFRFIPTNLLLFLFLSDFDSGWRIRLEFFLELHLTTLGHFDSDARFIIRVCWCPAHHLDDILTALSSSKHDMFTVKPGARFKCDEELGAVAIWTGICHRQQVLF